MKGRTGMGRRRAGRAGILWLAVVALMATGTVGVAQEGGDRSRLARIVTQEAAPERCISRVTIERVDGRTVYVPPAGFDLPPGRHTMTGTVALDTQHCPLPAQANIARAVPPLEADFEAGKTYWIGFDHAGTDSEAWSLVVWKEE